MEINFENTMVSEEQALQYGSIKTVATEDTSETNTTPTLSIDSEFTRANVEALGDAVRKVDQDETTGLDLFCYVRCCPTDEGLIRQCRGVVFHKQEIVMKAFPYTVEYNHMLWENFLL